MKGVLIVITVKQAVQTPKLRSWNLDWCHFNRGTLNQIAGIAKTITVTTECTS